MNRKNEHEELPSLPVSSRNWTITPIPRTYKRQLKSTKKRCRNTLMKTGSPPKLSPSTRLSLYDLQQKLVLLLCLHTLWRPRSDIGRLQFRDTILRYSKTDHSVAGVVLHIRIPKEAQQKTMYLGLVIVDRIITETE